jgi:hypothetical protein
MRTLWGQSTLPTERHRNLNAALPGAALPLPALPSRKKKPPPTENHRNLNAALPDAAPPSSPPRSTETIFVSSLVC